MFDYRKEIDGLRALAVIPVIFYHCGLTMYFSGGYVGVDIFFVISGYLITSVILNECDEERFSLINFYERRCRRILPALFLILLLSSIISYYFMLPEQIKEFGETLISIVCFSSNIYFWWKDDGYFSQISQLNPLIHTWSLAVEEQFYLLFPLLCYLFIKKKLYLLIILVFCAMISLFLSQWGGNLQLISINQFQMFSQHRFASFYLPLGRIWELLIGSFIGFYLQDKDSTKKFSHKSKQLLSFFGFILIIISIVFFNSKNIPPFPNFYTLIPTFGSVLIIIFGDNTTFIGYILSTYPLRYIGLISYSAYLCHQPLLVFIRLKSNEISQMRMMMIIIVISSVFLYSIFSYLYVEQPFRNKNLFSQKQIFCISSLAFIITFIVGLFLIQIGNNRSLLRNNETDTYLHELKEYGDWRYVVRAFQQVEKEKKNFSNQTITLNKRIILIGDSYAEDFYNMIIEGKHLSNYEILVYMIYHVCQIYLGLEDRTKFIEAKHRQLCTNAYDIKYVLPLIRQANIIILASNWFEWSAQRLPMTIKLLNLTKEQQIFVIGAKQFGIIDTMLYVNKSTQFRIQQYQYPLEGLIKVNNLLEKTLDKSIFVNVLKMICTGYNNTCPLFTPDGKLISYDGNHLTKHGAHYIGNIILKNEPLNKLK